LSRAPESNNHGAYRLNRRSQVAAASEKGECACPPTRHNLLGTLGRRQARLNRPILIPIGSCEKHGPHIPLGTDSYVTIEAVERAARLSKVPHAPLVPIGFSPHHMGEPGWGTGTISLPADTFRDVLWAIGKSLIYAGFNKLIFVSHHGSNSRPMEEALRRLRFECGAFTAWYKTPTERECTVLKEVLEGPPEETPGWHSCELETAAMVAYAEDQDLRGPVGMERAKRRAHAPEWMGPAFSKKTAWAR
jgi:creatinine amidohydrolase